MTTRRCLKCSHTYPLTSTHFYRRYDGFQWVCKACQRAYCREWRKQNLERVRAVGRAWHWEHRDEVLRARRVKRLVKVLEALVRNKE